MSNDEFVREVTALVDVLLSGAVIDYDWHPDAPNQWQCAFCGGAVPVVYRPQRDDQNWLLPPIEPCPIDTFPHCEACPVTMARRLQYYVR